VPILQDHPPADGITISVSGFPPLAVRRDPRELRPGTDRRPLPDAVAGVLRWAGGPMTGASQTASGAGRAAQNSS
jgi:hypothetical protein